MSRIHKKQLPNGVQVVWATPLSGYGHVADEQPLPYLQYKNVELTPRFGGEESFKESGINTIPLPYGKLNISWPWRQRMFNIFRRSINIYWRNIIQSRTRSDRFFYFLEQLNFRESSEGFIGESPILKFSRSFLIEGNTIKIYDEITFKTRIGFETIYLCPWSDFEINESTVSCKITCSLEPNSSQAIQSSTGHALWHAHKLVNVIYNKGDKLSWHYLYQIK